ncbi:MAG TPA: cell division control protein Cdc6, partial [Thermoprotei archaeon]|nr:cell division control protein Cdc6 [Thermoprotei archaeon]
MSVFRDKESLTPKYIPERLPHRDKEIGLLFDLYRDFSYSRIIQLEGQAGTGKTSTVHLVGMKLNNHAAKIGVD